MPKSKKQTRVQRYLFNSESSRSFTVGLLGGCERKRDQNVLVYERWNFVISIQVNSIYGLAWSCYNQAEYNYGSNLRNDIIDLTKPFGIYMYIVQGGKKRKLSNSCIYNRLTRRRRKSCRWNECYWISKHIIQFRQMPLQRLLAYQDKDSYIYATNISLFDCH